MYICYVIDKCFACAQETWEEVLDLSAALKCLTTTWLKIYYNGCRNRWLRRYPLSTFLAYSWAVRLNINSFFFFFPLVSVLWAQLALWFGGRWGWVLGERKLFLCPKKRKKTHGCRGLAQVKHISTDMHCVCWKDCCDVSLSCTDASLFLSQYFQIECVWLKASVVVHVCVLARASVWNLGRLFTKERESECACLCARVCVCACACMVCVWCVCLCVSGVVWWERAAVRVCDLECLSLLSCSHSSSTGNRASPHVGAESGSSSSCPGPTTPADADPTSPATAGGGGEKGGGVAAVPGSAGKHEDQRQQC